MRPFSSPLEHLTAFVIVFAAGVISTASFIGYMERVRRNAVRDYYKRANAERTEDPEPAATSEMWTW